MAAVAVYDACVLFSAPMRDLLLRIAAANLVRARWTDTILDECFRAILRERPDLQASSLARTRELINSAVPECLVVGFEKHVQSIQLPDPNDRHVVAAAITCGAEFIITMNTSDFPDNALVPFMMKAVHPDAFVLEAIEQQPDAIRRIISEQASALRKPAMTVHELLDSLQTCGLVCSSKQLRKLNRR